MTEWITRGYREGDDALLAATITAGWEADGLEIRMGTGEVEPELRHMDVNLESGVIVVEGPRPEGLPEQCVPGWAALGMREDHTSSERIYHPRIAVHPTARPLGLERELVRRVFAMVREHEARPGVAPVEKVRVSETFSPKQVSQKELFERAGLRLERVFWTMRCPLDNLQEPSQVKGVRIRPLDLPGDTERLRDALNRSFIDHYDFHPPSDERWDARLNNPAFRPGLSWVAEVEEEPDRLAGFCLCGIFDEENAASGRKEGWIETLGTVRGWRGKGLGRALLLYGLHSLRDSGLDTGALGVDSLNPTGAVRLYESVGFYVYDEWLSYGCLLSDVREEQI